MRNDHLRHAKIELLRSAQLRGYVRNARLHSDAQVKQIAASISEFGFVNPIIVDEADTIIAGHGRLAAARLLGLDEVPCIRVVGLSEAQRRALVLADNKLALNASWDEKLLAEELRALQDEVDLGNLDFKLDEVVGFTNAEFEDLMAVIADPTPPEDPRDVTLEDEPAVCRTGETWLLGMHRLTIGGPDIARDADALILQWQRASRLDAKLAGSGQTFKARAEEMGIEFKRTEARAHRARHKAD